MVMRITAFPANTVTLVTSQEHNLGAHTVGKMQAGKKYVINTYIQLIMQTEHRNILYQDK